MATRSDDFSVGGWERVTGATTFTADVRVPGALHVAFVYATVPHARITSVDVAPALALPGVVDAITGADIGTVLLGRSVKDYPVLATDRVLFVGQRVAAVAATDRELARTAAGMVEVEYEPLTMVLDATESLAAGADVLHPGYADYVGAVVDRPGPNTQGIWEVSNGDVQDAFARADAVFDETFVCGRNHSAPLEPHSCIVWAGSDRIEVWATNKEPYSLRRHIAVVAQATPEDVLVHLCAIGGDFGSKGFTYIEAVCYLLSARTGRPVRSTMSYDEELTTTASRHPTAMRLRTAVSGSTLLATDVDTLLDGGAFGAIKAAPMVVVPVIGAPLGSYKLEGRHDRCVSVYTNNLPGGHVRSPGEVQALFAGESHIDSIASQLGVDPIEFRLANARNPRVTRVLEELRDVVIRWRAECGPDEGIGVAACFRDSGPGKTTVRCVAERGSGVELVVSVADQGAGSYELFRQLAAKTLSLPTDMIRIRPVPVGTDERLEDAGAGASRVTVVAGGAVVDACRALATEVGEVPDEPSASWLDERLDRLGVDRVVTEGTAAAGWPAPPGVDARSHGAIAIQLKVDRETGQLSLQRAFLVADTGLVVNPVAHRGQLEGGFIYGLSQAMLEDLVVDDGQVVTATLGDYRIASAADVPPLEVVLIEPEGDDAAVLSVGELINVGVAPALANAVFDAVGARVRETPINPERILQALRASSPDSDALRKELATCP